MPIIIDFSVNTQRGSSPLAVTFSPIFNVRIPVKNIVWYFGDGVKSTEFKPKHNYQHGGNFSPKLEIIFQDGSDYTEFKQDYISVYKVKIISSENSGIVPFIVKFSVEASLPFGASIVTYDWDFGDGTPHSTEESPVHLYTTTKKYNVSLENTFSQS